MNKAIIIGIVGAIILNIVNTGDVSVRWTIEDDYLHTKIAISPETKEWTLMFYCGGDEDPQVMGSQVLIDLLEKCPYISNEKLNILVLLDYDDRSYLGKVKLEFGNIAKFEIIEEYDELNMGDYATLKDFLNRCKTEYPAERYFLQLVGHAIAFFCACPDCETGNPFNPVDELTMREIRDALQETNGVDIFATTGCLMGSIECAYEFRECTSVYIASEESYYMPMVPITVVKDLKVFRNHYSLSNYEIAEKIIEELNNNILPPPSSWFTLSAIRTDRLDKVREKLDVLLSLLMDNLEENRGNVSLAYSNVESFHDFTIDLYDFVDLTTKNTIVKPIVIGGTAEGEITGEQVQNEERIVEEQLSSLVESSVKSSEQSPTIEGELEDVDITTEIFVNMVSSNMETYVNNLKNAIEDSIIAESHRYGHKDAHGLSIYFPGEYYPSDPYYEEMTQLEFKSDSNWDEFLFAYLDSDSPDIGER